MATPENTTKTEATESFVDKVTTSLTDYAGKYALDTYDYSKKLANEKAIEPVVQFSKPKIDYVVTYSAETYDVATKTFAEVLDKLLLSLGSRKAPLAEPAVAEAAVDTAAI